MTFHQAAVPSSGPRRATIGHLADLAESADRRMG